MSALGTGESPPITRCDGFDSCAVICGRFENNGSAHLLRQTRGPDVRDTLDRYTAGK
jgi:hypothetical protein